MSILQYRNTHLYRANPFTQLTDFHRQVNRLLDLASVADTRQPRLDVLENKENVTVTIELPGLNREDIALSIQENVLTVSGERKDTVEIKEGESRRSERFTGKFQRSVELPVDVNPDQVTAVYKNGLLTVTLVKNEEVKPKQITIKVACITRNIMNTNTLENNEVETTEGARYVKPFADFHSKADGTQVRLDLPGVGQDGLEITVEEQLLTIVGRRKNRETTGEWVHQEIIPYDYRRVFSLATSIDTARIQAELRDGVLNLNLPVAEKVKPRRIEVA